jgi:hypothetical protein
MENMISGDPTVSGALVVGLRRMQCTLLLEGRNQEDRDSFIDQVWPTIQRANEVSPGHAQIARNMVLVILPNKPFQIAGKGTILRAATIKDYESEIDGLYQSSELSVSNTVYLPSLDNDSYGGMLNFVRKLVAFQMKDQMLLGDSIDIFSAGFDSLQTTQLSANIRTALRTHIRDGRKIAPRLLRKSQYRENFSNSQALLDSEAAGSNSHTNGVNRDAANSAKAESLRVSAMEDVIGKFSSTLSTKRLIDKLFGKTGTLTVLVTGTTSSLGQYLVEAILADTKVQHVYCFNRSLNAEEKFKNRATSVQNYRLDFFHVRLGEPGFGLPSKKLERLMQDVDNISHNSWKVSVSRLNPVT